MKNEMTKEPGSTVEEILYALEVRKVYLNMTQKPDTRKFHYIKVKNIYMAKKKKSIKTTGKKRWEEYLFRFGMFC